MSEIFENKVWVSGRAETIEKMRSHGMKLIDHGNFISPINENNFYGLRYSFETRNRPALEEASELSRQFPDVITNLFYWNVNTSHVGESVFVGGEEVTLWCQQGINFKCCVANQPTFKESDFCEEWVDG